MRARWIRSWWVAQATAMALLAPAEARAGAITPSPASVTFKDTGVGACSGPTTVTLANSSGGAARLTAIALAGPDAGQFALAAPGVPLTLVDGASIGVDVTFCPVGASGPRSANLELTVEGENSPTDVALGGSAVGPRIVVSPSPVVIGGVKLGALVAPVQVTVSNGGGGVVNVASVAPAGADAGRLQVSGLPAFPRALGPGASFTFTLGYAPVAAGPAQATVRVVSDDPTSPVLDAPLQAYVGDPKVMLDLAQILFGDQLVGTRSDPQTVMLTNGGYSDLMVSALTVAGDDPGEFQVTSAPPAPFTLKVNQSATLTVTCAPTMAGPRSGRVQVVSDDPLSPATLPVSASGTTPAAMVDRLALDFGAVRVASTAQQAVTLSNAGSGPVQVLTLAVTGADPMGVFTIDQVAPLTIAPGGSVVVTVTFSPQQVQLYKMSALTIGTDDPKLPMGTVTLAGSGVSPVLSVSPMALDFGTVPVGQQSTAMPFTIANTGNDVMQVTALQLGGPGQVAFTLTPAPPDPPFAIAPGASQTYRVTYAPTDGSGDDAQVLISTDVPGVGDVTVALTGVGAEAVFAAPVDMDTLDFGGVAVGGRKSLTVTIQNAGTADLRIVSLTVTTGSPDMPVLSNDFAPAETGPLAVPPGQSHVVTLTFQPTAATSYAATLEIDPDPSDPAILPVHVLLSGTGVPTAVSCVTSAPDNGLDFGQVAVGAASPTQFITVLNAAGTAQAVMVASGAPEFAIDQDAVTIAAAGKATVGVVFTPGAAQAYGAPVTVSLPGSAAPLCSVQVRGVGIGTSAPTDGGELVPLTSRGCLMAGARPPERDAGGLPVLVLLAAGLVARRERRRSG